MLKGVSFQRRCKGAIRRGKREERCKNPILKDAESDFCKKCSKNEKKVWKKKESSPTRQMIKECMENEIILPNIFAREAFLWQDYKRVYKRKIGEKLFKSSSVDLLKNVPVHWKYILEVITAKRELGDELAAVLILVSDGRIKRSADNCLYMRRSRDSYWIKTDEIEVSEKIMEFRKEILDEADDILDDVLTESKNEKEEKEIQVIIKAVKKAYNFKVKKDTINIFLKEIPQKRGIIFENPIGQRFIDDIIQFTNDEKFYGVTTKKIWEAREKWIKDNSKYNLPSCQTITVFGRIINQNRTWKTETGPHGLLKHLGIRII